MSLDRPCVLTISGHDPTGGAGIQADIESLLMHRCHPCSVLTCLTEQDTADVNTIFPQSAQSLLRQLRRLLSDIHVQTIKIGLPGSIEIVRTLQDILRDYAKIPVILDPVLAAGGGKRLASPQLVEEIGTRLVPLAKVLTPNADEARLLSGNRQTLAECGHFLLSRGCEFVLITGTEEPGLKVTNRLFRADGKSINYSWERLPFSYHGSGCTLAANIAGLIATGHHPVSAIEKAQQMTWDSLRNGFKPGKGQYVPDRLRFSISS